MSQMAQAVQKAVEGMKEKRKATARPRRATAAETAIIKKATGAKHKPRVAQAPWPSVEEWRVSPAGVQSPKGVRYLSIDFTNGFTVKLLPVGVKDQKRASDAVAAWLHRRLA